MYFRVHVLEPVSEAHILHTQSTSNNAQQHTHAEVCGFLCNEKLPSCRIVGRKGPAKVENLDLSGSSDEICKGRATAYNRKECKF